jgi:hypothetical protein
MDSTVLIPTVDRPIHKYGFFSLDKAASHRLIIAAAGNPLRPATFMDHIASFMVKICAKIWLLSKPFR